MLRGVLSGLRHAGPQSLQSKYRVDGRHGSPQHRLRLFDSVLAAAFALGFTPSAPLAVQSSRSMSVRMSEQPLVARRELLSSALGVAAASVAFPAFADGANSAQGSLRARAIYGSRIYRLQGKDAAAILEEKNAFTLFISGTYRAADVKATKTQLTALQKTVLAAAEKGDSAGAQAALKDFIKVGAIEADKDVIEGGNFNPKQRRNAGAPMTSEIELIMGTQKTALYGPNSR